MRSMSHTVVGPLPGGRGGEMTSRSWVRAMRLIAVSALALSVALAGVPMAAGTRTPGSDASVVLGVAATATPGIQVTAFQGKGAGPVGAGKGGGGGPQGGGKGTGGSQGGGKGAAGSQGGGKGAAGSQGGGKGQGNTGVQSNAGGQGNG